MDQSWLTSTIDYMYKTVSGENHEGMRISDYQRAFSNGICVNDLPFNNYEPLTPACLSTHRATPKERHERKSQELQKKISTLQASCAVKCKEVESLTEQLEEKKKNYRKRENECDQKNIDTQHQLKKAKKAAFVAKGNLIKKERELDYLNSVIQLNQEQDMKLERVITFLQNELSNLRDEIDGLKNVMLGKVDEITSQLTASNAELAKIKEREKQLIEKNASIKDEMVQLQGKFETFKKKILEEIADSMKHQQFRSTIMQTQCDDSSYLHECHLSQSANCTPTSPYQKMVPGYNPKACAYLHGRPLLQTFEYVQASTAQFLTTGNRLKGEDEGFFTRTFNKFFGF